MLLRVHVRPEGALTISRVVAALKPLCAAIVIVAVPEPPVWKLIAPL